MRKLLMVGRTRYRLPLSDSLARKFSALRDALDVRVVASSADGSRGDDTFSLWRRLPVLDGAAFYGALPFRVARELRRFRPDAVTTQSPYEALAVLAARGLARSRAALIVELHGDWRTFPRLYGSPLASRAVAGDGPRRAVGAAPRRRRADAVALHDRPGARGRRRAGGRLHRLHRPRGVHGASCQPTCLPSRGRSSSACSSRTRTSRISPPPGGSSPSACPKRRCA